NGGAWTNLYNGSSNSLTDYNTNVAATLTRTYRVVIRKTNVCAYDSSATYTVTINPRSVGTDNNITPTVANANICSGSIVSVSVSSLGSGNSIQKWIYRTNDGAWIDFAY